MGRTYFRPSVRQSALKTGRTASGFDSKMALVVLFVFLTAFVTSRAVAAAFDSGWYTDNCPRGTETITGGILQTRESTPGGGADNYGYCTAQRGSFPWGSTVGTLLPTGLANVTVTASFLARTPVNGSFSGSRDNIYVGLYYYLKVPQTVSGATHNWMDTQVRIENIDGVDSPVGTTGLYDSGDSFGWDLVVAQLNPGQSYTFWTNVESQFESAVSAYGIPIGIGHSLMGIEIGTEAYQIQQLDVKWSDVNFNGAPSPIYANHPPTLITPRFESAVPGSSLAFTVSVTDPDPGEIVTLSTQHLPSGASFNSSTGVFSWTPLSNQTGNYTISFTVTDNGSPPMTDTKSVTVTVTGLPAHAACLSCQVSNFVLANLWWAVGGTLAGFILAWSASRLRLRLRAAILRQF